MTTGRKPSSPCSTCTSGHVTGFESLIGAAFMNLWDCAFEDSLTRQDSEGRNIVDDYLRRRGWKETATSKRYMTALRSSVMSLYEVSDIVPGESFLASDLVRGGEPLRVHERAGSKTFKEWDRIGARLVDMGSKTEKAGGVLLYDRATTEDLLEDLKKMVAKLPEHRKRLAVEMGHRGGHGQVLASRVAIHFPHLLNAKLPGKRVAEGRFRSTPGANRRDTAIVHISHIMRVVGIT